MGLIDTVDLMISERYEDNFKAEYAQLKFRQKKLRQILLELDEGHISLQPACPRMMLEMQLKAMTDYLDVMTERAKIEKIEV